MIIGVILLVLAATLIGLAVWVLNKYQKSAGIFYYSGFLFGLGLIALTDALLYLLPVAVDPWIARTGYMTGVFTFSMLLMFTANYPRPIFSRRPLHVIWWLGPLLFFFPIFLMNETTVQAIVRQGNGFIETHGAYFWTFPLFVAGYGILTVINLFRQLKGVVGSEQRRVRIFLATLVFAIILASVFDVLLPALGHPRYPVGINSGAIIFALSVAIIVK